MQPTFSFAATQLYVAVAIVVALAAIVAADVRSGDKLLPRWGINVCTLTLIAASWLGILQILAETMLTNEYDTMTKFEFGQLVLHSILLILILVVVSFWYKALAVYKETPGGRPTSPPRDPD